MLLISVGSACAAAAEVDPTTLYDLVTEGSSQKLKAGTKGMFVLTIRTKNGSHVSNETPLKIDLTGERLALDKQKLTYADSVTSKAAGPRFPDPRFEVPFTGNAVGKTVLEANILFFICTEKVCARQVRRLQLPVEVVPF